MATGTGWFHDLKGRKIICDVQRIAASDPAFRLFVFECKVLEEDSGQWLSGGRGDTTYRAQKMAEAWWNERERFRAEEDKRMLTIDYEVLANNVGGVPVGPGRWKSASVLSRLSSLSGQDLINEAESLLTGRGFSIYFDTYKDLVRTSINGGPGNIDLMLDEIEAILILARAEHVRKLMKS